MASQSGPHSTGQNVVLSEVSVRDRVQASP